MEIVIDASAILAVVVGEPERSGIIREENGVRMERLTSFPVLIWV